MRDALPTNGRSALAGKTFRLAGFSFQRHPSDACKFLQMSLYRGEHEWVICLSEGRGNGSPRLARLGLGGEVPGAAIAPFAQRGIVDDGDSRISFSDLKGLLEADANGTWEWADLPAIEKGGNVGGVA